MILIACGLQREAAILARDGVIAIPGGGVSKALETGLEGALELFPGTRLILSCGIAGALDPTLRAGDLIFHLPPFVSSEVEKQAPNDVIGVSTSLETIGWEGWVERLKSALPRAYLGAIIGQDHIAATVAEKAALHATTGAIAVDMESHVAARVAARHGLPFAAIRTISDTAGESLPPAALVGMNPDGSMALGRVLASLARHPAQLPALIRTGRSAEVAFKALVAVGDAIALLQG